MIKGRVSPQALDLAHSYIMDDWVWDFGYETWRPAALAETIFWFAASGQAISHITTVTGWAAHIKKGQLRRIPQPASDRWRGSQQVATLLCQKAGSTAFGWFTDYDPTEVWEVLQEIKYVGPKIAAWVLRDISLLRDYSTEIGSRRIAYHDRDASWFRQLPPEWQAVFLPLDRWVIRGATQLKIVPESLRLERLQNGAYYREMAGRIASWAGDRHIDPRDLDVYLYLRGTRFLKEDGTTNGIVNLLTTLPEP